jgi:2-succinyl-5-enolpyruvyl-6-hydroxy-3-cyclohexene-1-carboxylate synthase
MAGIADTGVTHVFVSPGSRNTPLTLAAIAEDRITDISIRDERSAGFMALGFAKVTGRPAVVLCTSGSAATHYFPAIVEADQATAPLIVLTADRPAALRGTGAPQTMNQIDLFGTHVKHFLDADTSDDGRALGHSLVASALTRPAGPVHANVAFDEPLVPVQLPEPVPPLPFRQSTEPYRGSTSFLDDLPARTLFVASGRQDPGFGDLMGRIASHLGAPVLADPQTPVTGSAVVHHGDLLIAAHGEGLEPILDRLRPDAVIRLGPLPTSKPLWQWLETSGVDQVLVDSTRLGDPLASASVTVDADPTVFLSAQHLGEPADHSYLDDWLAMDRIAGMALDRALDDLGWPSEPEIARSMTMSAPEGCVFYLASSRPIRDIDAFGISRSDLSVVANRGVNGIDGTISSAVGGSLGGRATLLLIGDVAALHDATALAEAVRLGAPVRIVVVNNDGGGIFSFLPQARSGLIDDASYERHWGTPHGLSLGRIAEAMGMHVITPQDRDAFRAAVSAPIRIPEMIEVVTDRHRVVEDHQAIRRSVSNALRRGDEFEERPQLESSLE